MTYLSHNTSGGFQPPCREEEHCMRLFRIERKSPDAPTKVVYVVADDYSDALIAFRLSPRPSRGVVRSVRLIAEEGDDLILPHPSEME